MEMDEELVDEEMEKIEGNEVTTVIILMGTNLNCQGMFCLGHLIIKPRGNWPLNNFLKILIDRGGTHNFLNLVLAKKLRCKLEYTTFTYCADGTQLDAQYICRGFFLTATTIQIYF
ncbi:MAG: hypothetical protein Q8844_02675 [Pigeon pea little leaf phytoplasma]|nr:hypothetical protein [Pigeon pea little leaf phytoplasma]